MGFLVSPIVANLYMEHLEREALRSATHPNPGFGSDMWMTPFSFNNRPTNRYSWII